MGKRSAKSRQQKNPIMLPWWGLLERYALPSDRPASRTVDQLSNPRVKLASDTLVRPSAQRLESRIAEEFTDGTYSPKGRIPLIFSSSVGGGDDALSLYAATLRAVPDGATVPVIGLFHDVSDWKLDYLLVRAYLAAATGTVDGYLDALLMASTHYGADRAAAPLDLLDKVANSSKQPPGFDQHKEHLRETFKGKRFGAAELEALEPRLDRLVQLLHWKRGNKINYKNLAAELQEDLITNAGSPATHWLLNGNLTRIGDAVRQGNVKVLQVDLDTESGKRRYSELIAPDGKSGRRVTLALHKAYEKFRKSEDLATTFDHFLTTSPSKQFGVEREWVLDAPYKIFQQPRIDEIFGGDLDIAELEALREARNIRVEQNLPLDFPSKLMLLGDMPVGSPGHTAESEKLLAYSARIAHEHGAQAVLITGTPFASVPRTKKQHRGQFFLKDDYRDVYKQLEHAAEIINQFPGKKFAVSTEELAAWVEQVASERFDGKFEDAKAEDVIYKGMPRSDRRGVMNRLFAESYFEAVQECYEAVERELGLDSGLADRLNLEFSHIKLRLQHKRPSQYFSMHTGPGAVRKDMKLHNQKAARAIDHASGSENAIRTTGHDIDLRVQVFDPQSMQISVPGTIDIRGYSSMPEEIRRDLWSMVHKSVAVKGKFPDMGAVYMEHTPDGRILIQPILHDFLPLIHTNPNVKEVKRTLFSTSDRQEGSLANRNNAAFYLKYLDYTTQTVPREHEKEDWKLVWVPGGDLVEGANYPKAQIRNDVALIGHQIELYKLLCAPFVEQKDERGHMVLNPLIAAIMTLRGNHEMNSTNRVQAFNAIDAIYGYYQGILKSQFGGDLDAVRQFMPHSEFNVIERAGNKEELFNLMAGAYTVCGYKMLFMHNFAAGSTAGGDFAATMEAWLDNAGSLAKEYAILHQFHWHVFGMGSHAGKLELSWPAPTSMSDYEYQMGKSTKYQQMLLHLSNKRPPMIEILTSRFFDQYQMRHPLFQKTSPERYYEDMKRYVREPVPL